MYAPSEKGGIRMTANRLRREKSPYLLQHAENPVDWYPWGEEAFARAREEDKPIFLSIGYSTCHWCHVMAHESFEDPEIAALLNENFVSIKVDREERPDIDQIYMTVCQVMTGRGGWPLTIVMTPDRKPFFAGSYIPKETRFGMTGLTDLLPRIIDTWKSRRQIVDSSAEKITLALEEIAACPAGNELGEEAIEGAYRELLSQYDGVFGGFGRAPKFPTPHHLLFLLRYWLRSGEEDALDMVERTLQRMCRGGIWDHVGFGFHRYSTDAEWLVPHFEKMIYDQAMLAIAYTEAYQATGDARYRRVADEILTYVLRDMMREEGGFYSAEDADSEGVEGKFYLWTQDEIIRALEYRDASLIIPVYNIHRSGNFKDETGGQPNGRNILFMSDSPDHFARRHGIAEDRFLERLDEIREALFAARKTRVPPMKDDKILTDWNGLMVAALAYAGRAYDDPAYLDAARRTAAFLLETMQTEDGRLFHRFREGEADIPGNLDDYAFLSWGLIELYESTFDIGYLEAALAFTSTILAHFWDDERGGCFFTPDDGETLIMRRKEIYDGAYPSGNAVSMQNMIRLSRLTGDVTFEQKAAAIGRAFSTKVKQSPAAHTHLLSALCFALGPSQEVVVVGRPGSDDTRRMLKRLNRAYLPSTVTIFRPRGEDTAVVDAIAPYTKDMGLIGGTTAAYVCHGGLCSLPSTNPMEVLDFLAIRQHRFLSR
jgi:uncharacterized protein YyaL (SSP411 family)